MHVVGLSPRALDGRMMRERIAAVLVGGVVAVCMMSGFLDWAGMPSSLSRILSELMAIILIAISFFQPNGLNRRRAAALSAPLVAAACVGIGIGVLHDAEPVELVLFMREMLTPALFLFAFLCAPVGSAALRRVLGFLAALGAVQVVVCGVKFLTLGVNEKVWIGTMTQSAGQLGLLMPAMAMGFAWAFGLVKSRSLLAGGCVLLIGAVSVVSEKRATMFLVPLIPVLTLAAWLFVGRLARLRYERTGAKSARYLAVVVLVSALVGSGSLALIPSLNADNHRYALYGTQSVVDYIRVYLTRDYDSPMNISKTSIDENRNIQLGRALLLTRAVRQSFEQQWSIVLVGHGGGWLLEHRFLPHKGGDVLYDRVGLRGPSGLLVRHLFEIGWVGVVLVLAWMGALAALLLMQLRKAPDSVLAFGALTSVAVLVFDYTFYSEMAWNSGVFMPIFLLLVAFAMRPDVACQAERGC